MENKPVIGQKVRAVKDCPQGCFRKGDIGEIVRLTNVNSDSYVDFQLRGVCYTYFSEYKVLTPLEELL